MRAADAGRGRSESGDRIGGLKAAADWAHARGCRRLWLTTSNDNLDAIRFYERRGMRLVAVHRDALDEARRIKPSIPEVGENGIPIRDEVEFELDLGGPGACS